jgi:hypothetical protein
VRRQLRWTVGLLLAVFLVLTLVGLSHSSDDPAHWGTKVEWIAMTVTALTLIAVLVTLYLQVDTYRHQINRERRSEASLVWAYTEGVVVGEETKAYEARFQVGNNSRQPATAAEIVVLPWQWTRASEPLEHGRVDMGTLLPGAVQQSFVLGTFPAPPPDWPEFRPIPIRFTFTDGAGVRWRRWPDGQLEEEA